MLCRYRGHTPIPTSLAVRLLPVDALQAFLYKVSGMGGQRAANDLGAPSTTSQVGYVGTFTSCIAFVKLTFMLLTWFTNSLTVDDKCLFYKTEPETAMHLFCMFLLLLPRMSINDSAHWWGHAHCREEKSRVQRFAKGVCSLFVVTGRKWQRLLALNDQFRWYVLWMEW